MTYRYTPFTALLASLLLVMATSCEKFSGDQEIPAYLTIDSIYLTTDYYTQGTASQRITDAWIYVDDQFLGAYELPAQFPVLETGKHEVKIWPGIKKNGIAATRVAYEFYNAITRNVNLTPDSTTRIGVVKTTYQPTTNFIWKEDFEDVGVSLDTTKGSSAFIQRTAAASPQTFEGNHSGMVAMDTVRDFFECQTHAEYAIPASPVFLEMNFNTNDFMQVGVITYGSTILYMTPILTLQPTNGTWKKIYIDLTTSLNAYTGMFTYRVYLTARKSAGQMTSTLLFDNFKVVSRSGK